MYNVRIRLVAIAVILIPLAMCGGGIYIWNTIGNTNCFVSYYHYDVGNLQAFRETELAYPGTTRNNQSGMPEGTGRSRTAPNTWQSFRGAASAPAIADFYAQELAKLGWVSYDGPVPNPHPTSPDSGRWRKGTLVFVLYFLSSQMATPDLSSGSYSTLLTQLPRPECQGGPGPTPRTP
jgi:hypothetical protein